MNDDKRLQLLENLRELDALVPPADASPLAAEIRDAFYALKRALDPLDLRRVSAASIALEDLKAITSLYSRFRELVDRYGSGQRDWVQ